MNFYSPATSFRKDDDYNILDCSSQCEIYEEEIADTSSPECSEKKHPLSTLGLSSSNRKKNSVKRKLFLQKPTLDIHPTNSNVFVNNEGHFRRIKRKKWSTYEANFSDRNHEPNSVKHLQNSFNESSVHSGVSIGSELNECNYNAALTAGLIKSPSPEIISEEEGKVNLESYCTKDEIICSQDSPEKFSFEDEDQLSIKAFCKTSNTTDTIGHEGGLNDCDIKEDIIYSQDSPLDITIKNENCIIDTVELNMLLDPMKVIHEEGHESGLNGSDIKEDIICSQDSLVDIPIKNKKCISDSVELNKLLDPVKVIQEEGHEGSLNDSVIKEDIICSQDSLVDIPIKNKKCISDSVELNKLLNRTKVIQEKGDEDSLTNFHIKEDIICSQDSLVDIPIKNKNYIIESIELKETLDCIELLQEKDNKHHSDLDISQEDIIYSQDSPVDKSGILHDFFSKTCDELNVSSSPSKVYIEEAKSGKQEENIELDVSEIDDRSERDPHVTLTSYNNSLIMNTIFEKTEAARNSEESNQKYNDSISSQTSNMISSTLLNEPDSEFLVKAPKKGTLLQRSYHIISELKKEANLLSYEIQVGLKASKGAFVSDPLIIQNIYFEEKYYLISCKPQTIEEKNNHSHAKESIYLITPNLSMDMRINSVIVIHFPLAALLGLPVMRVILFAENRIQVISSNRVTGSINISLPNSIIGPSDHKLMCVIKEKKSKTVIGALVDQLFGNLCSLELKLLHIYEQRRINHTAVELLTVDSENQFCLVKYSGNNLLNNPKLEVNNSYVFLGFSVMSFTVKHELKSAAEYYSSLKFKNSFIYIAEPCIDSWKIKDLFKTTKNSIHYTSLNSIIRNRMNHERFKLLLEGYTALDNKILIKDETFSEMIELQFDEECYEDKLKLKSLSGPFVLCGIYFLNGCIYYDKYCQLMNL